MWRYLAILGLLCLTAAALSQDEPQSGGVEAFLDRAVPRAAAPGLAYALVENGDVQLGERGERVAGSGLPVTEDTPFALGSISKSFTALAILQLVEAGRVELDHGIGEYLDVFDGQAGGTITIRQLLSHTSGYSTLQGNQSHTDGAGETDGLANRVRQLAAMAPAGAPGSEWQYSNANYLILGGLIETVSGLEYGDYIETRILEPLGMDDSFVADGEVHEAMAIGHTPWFGGRRPVADRRTVRGMAPAGGVMASAADVARYLAMMVNGEDDLISAEHKAMMMRPANAASPHYGFGWFLDAEADAAYHTGLTPGVETIAILSRAERRGGVVLVNANSGMGFGVTGDILTGVAALALGDTPRSGGNHLGAKSLYVMLLVLPVLFLAGIATAWLRRDGLRAKSGAFGLFSLVFPLVATLAMAWVFLHLLPRLFGVPLVTLNLYQPDLAVLLVASSVCGVGFAVFRLAVAYSGRK